MAADETFLDDFDDVETLKALANLEAPSVAVCKILWMSMRTFSTSILATSSAGRDLEVEAEPSSAEEVLLSPEVIRDLSHFSSFLYLRAIKMASNQCLNDITIGFVESNSFLKKIKIHYFSSLNTLFWQFSRGFGDKLETYTLKINHSPALFHRWSTGEPQIQNENNFKEE